ncbi:MAG: toll-Interleukin receptor [Candidatus Cloacimonetes bacterium HGW-Cloacimonetes-2]|jgi:hypothetical protein|nr:MAG: toll-Interleukin receptor [Candidatus Cloacimonetes bacterium HGW-Cloacimonetes-2]
MPLFKKSEINEYQVKKSILDAEQVLIKEAASFDEEGYDIFLSHSYRDAKMILKIKRIIEDMGFSIYVDWIDDPQLDRTNVKPDTADLIRNRIDSSRCLIYVTTENSVDSKWMPWELGYADGAKGGLAAVLPVSESLISTETYIGLEFLGLYCYVTKNTIMGTQKSTLWVKKDNKTYVMFEDWLEGKLPFRRKETANRFLL